MMASVGGDTLPIVPAPFSVSMFWNARPWYPNLRPAFAPSIRVAECKSMMRSPTLEARVRFGLAHEHTRWTVVDRLHGCRRILVRFAVTSRYSLRLYWGYMKDS